MHRLALLFALVLALGCASSIGARQPPVHRVTLSARFVDALVAEAGDPLAADGYLELLALAMSHPDDPLARAATLASLDALVWRRVHDMPPGVEHALAHRSRPLLERITARLRELYAKTPGAGPFERALVADALHAIALRVGDPKAAAKWRRRAGCVPAASVVGPVGFPPLGSLTQDAPKLGTGPLPEAMRGIPPFGSAQAFERVHADACSIDIDETSSLRGLRLVVVDIDNPRSQRVHVALASSSAARVELGGVELLERPFAASADKTLRMASALVERGTARLVARVAQNQDGNTVRLMVLDDRGEPLVTRAPRPGARALARVTGAEILPADGPSRRSDGSSSQLGSSPEGSSSQLGSSPEGSSSQLGSSPDGSSHDIPLRAAALLAAGEHRAAAAVFEHASAPAPKDAPLAVDIVRLRALRAAAALPENQLLTHVEATATRIRDRCDDCWEARLSLAAAAKERKGHGGGVYALFGSLGVASHADGWETRVSAPALARIAVEAARAGLADVARRGYDALARRAPGSPMLADLDWALYPRSGAERVEASCRGGTSAAMSRCLNALVARSDLKGVLRELSRLRALRGSPAILRDIEMGQLWAFGRHDDALRIYDALSPGRRQVALLGEAMGSEREGEARRRFRRDVRQARDAPYALEPLGRLLGAIDDRTVAYEKTGAELVARDRREAFLPGAATAVLRHEERYHLGSDGLLGFWIYDLRRVSGTSDVAGGASSGLPLVEGRVTFSQLLQRIHKKDGRILDPDPSAQGSQQATELSQLQAGDYVEAITVGFALPDESGQLVVDTPDILPLRTSVRDALIVLSRPAALGLAVWSHALLGKATTRTEGKQLVSTWHLESQPPRRVEEGEAPLEARVAISFGTDSWKRIARALGERLRTLDEDDPYMKRWIREIMGGEKLPPDKQVARLVAAVGKAVRRSDAYALSDGAATFTAGPQRETARWIVERGAGSRTWVVFRALSELGHESAIAVAEAVPFSASPGFPARTGRFTHPLVRVEIEGAWVWIDADVDGPPLPPGRVSPELRGRQALLATGEMVTVDVKTTLDVDEIDVRLVLDERGDATGTFTAFLHGQPAQGLADAFEVVVGSDREQLLRSVVLGWLPWADVKKVTLSSDQGSWQVAIRADIALVGFASPEDRKGKTWSLPGLTAVHGVYPHARTTTLGARYTAQAQRTAALVVDEPQLYHVHRRIELPKTMTVERLPGPVDIKGAELSASRTIAHTAGVVEEDFHLNLPVGTVTTETFDRFAEMTRLVDDGFMHSTRLVVSPRP